MTFTWNTDTVYTYTGDTLDYYVTSGEIMVYEGRAVKSPSKSGIEINLRKIAEDWLEMEFRDFLPMDGELYLHEEAFRSFVLHRSSDDTVLYEFNCVINDLGEPVSGINNDPVDGCADPRQKLFITYFGNWTGNTEDDIVVETEDEMEYFTVKVVGEDFPDEYLRRFIQLRYVPASAFTMDYSINGGEWVTVNVPSAVTPTEELQEGPILCYVNKGDTVRFRCVDFSHRVTKIDSVRYEFDKGSFDFVACGDVIIGGNYLSLEWGEDFRGKNSLYTSTATCSGMFRLMHDTVPYHKTPQEVDYVKSGRILDASKLSLPIAVLYDGTFPSQFIPGRSGFYTGMFLDQHELDGAPKELIAKVVPDYAYAYMFENCYSLFHAPRIDALTVGDYACESMFENCYSLVFGPELKATKVGVAGFARCFKDCTDLHEATVPMATELPAYACDSMYSGCTALNSLPAILPATAVSYCTYQEMFEGCVTLDASPMFRIANIFPYEIEVQGQVNQYWARSMADMFNGCTSLRYSEGSFEAFPHRETMKNMYKGCIRLVEPPEINSTDEITEDGTRDAFSSMFEGCSNLAKAKCMVRTSGGDGSYWFTNWLSGTASNGTLTRNSSGGVIPKPSGWTEVRV